MIYDTKLEQSIEYETFIESLPESMRMVLGEYHYMESIQSAQAQVIKDTVNRNNSASAFTVGWEFLNYIDQQNIASALVDYKSELLDDQAFFAKLFPNSSNPGLNSPYSHIMRVLKELDGQLIGTNATRATKRKLRLEGIDALEPEQVPPNHRLGGENYLERFKEAMQGHMSEELLQGYFLAQSYTDSVISYQLEKLATNSLAFLVVGSFHSDYNDGVVPHLIEISSEPVITTKFIDGSELTEAELDELIEPSPKYGPLADYLIIII